MMSMTTLRATKLLTKHFLLVEMHEPRKDKYTTLLGKSYKTCVQILSCLTSCHLSKIVVMVENFLTMLWNVFMFVCQ